MNQLIRILTMGVSLGFLYSAIGALVGKPPHSVLLAIMYGAVFLGGIAALICTG